MLYKNHTIEIEQDEYPMNPYEEWDRLGTLYHWHKRVFIGESLAQMSRESIQEKVNKLVKSGAVILPVYLYEHSGQTINTTGFSCPWDSGKFGFICATREKILAEYKCKRITRKTRDMVRDVLKSEIKTIDDYLTGNVWQYRITDSNGEILDSCSGYFGDSERCLDDAKKNVDSLECQALPLLAYAGLINQHVGV